MRSEETQRTHAERIERARSQAAAVEKLKGKPDIHRNIYMKQRRKAYEETKNEKG